MPVRGTSRAIIGAVLVVEIVGGMACSGSSTSPTPPPGSGPTGPAPACRTYPTADAATLSTTLGLTGTIVTTCLEYNRSTNELTCAANYSDSTPQAFSTNIVFKFASVADFIGDAPRIYIISTSSVHPMKVSTTQTTGVTTTSSYTYDSQGRVTRIDLQTNGGSSVQTFTSWDSFGRPTFSTLSNPNATLAYAYDDSARVGTITNNLGHVITRTFDANGIAVRQVSVTGSVTATQVDTIPSTAMVCR
jgi:YD repeat-containing protein